MKTQDLIRTISDHTHIPEDQVSTVIHAAFDALSNGLEPGEEVTIAGFGSFRISDRRTLNPEREAAWEEHFGPYLQTKEVQRKLGLTGADEVARLAMQHRILALPNGEASAFPAFQFTAHGELDQTISQVIMILSEVVETPYTIASWLKSPKEPLEGETPLRWLERGLDPKRVIDAANLTAARLAS